MKGPVVFLKGPGKRKNHDCRGNIVPQDVLPLRVYTIFVAETKMFLNFSKNMLLSQQMFLARENGQTLSGTHFKVTLHRTIFKENF